MSPSSVSAAEFWDLFIERLNEEVPLGKLGKHGAFIGSIEKYRGIYLRAVAAATEVTTAESDLDEQSDLHVDDEGEPVTTDEFVGTTSEPETFDELRDDFLDCIDDESVELAVTVSADELVAAAEEVVAGLELGLAPTPSQLIVGRFLVQRICNPRKTL